MNPDKQQIAIAEACPKLFKRTIGSGEWHYWNSTANRLLPCVDGDPLLDLNACHEMENALSEDQRTSYIQILCSDTADEQTCDLDPVTAEWNLTHATAAQRAEAFLRTLNKWEDA